MQEVPVPVIIKRPVIEGRTEPGRMGYQSPGGGEGGKGHWPLGAFGMNGQKQASLHCAAAPASEMPRLVRHWAALLLLAVDSPTRGVESNAPGFETTCSTGPIHPLDP